MLAIGVEGASASASKNHLSEYEDLKIADEILRQVSRRLKQEYGLQPIGTMGQMMNDIQVMDLSFDYYKSVDIPEGRRILINRVNELMN